MALESGVKGSFRIINSISISACQNIVFYSTCLNSKNNEHGKHLQPPFQRRRHYLFNIYNKLVLRFSLADQSPPQKASIV
jgi:hypothetical protein